MNASDKTSASDNAPSAVALLKDSVIMPSGSSKSWLSGEDAITSMYKHETPLAFDRTTNKMLLQPGAETATKGEGTVEGGGGGGGGRGWFDCYGFTVGGVLVSSGGGQAPRGKRRGLNLVAELRPGR